MPFKNASIVYKKAQEIEYLSDSISRSFLFEYEHLDEDGKEHPDVYFLGDLIRDSIFLSSEILLTENQPLRDQRIRYALKTRLRSSRLYNRCKRLEKRCSSGRDYILLLKKELKKFHKLQENWMTFL